MKSAILVLAVFFGLTAFIPANPSGQALEAPTWEIDQNHSSVAFSVRHFFSDVIGTFDQFEGTLKFDPEDLESSQVDFTIDVASVNTKNERRDNHLRSEDFFMVEDFPTMKFTSSSFEKSGDHYIAKGEMTIRDVTREMEIPIDFLGQMAHPRREGAYIGGFRAKFTIDRTEFGVGSGNFAATTTIGAEVDVTINLEVSRSES